MTVVELIERKRDGGALSPEEWRTLMAQYAAGDVPDYQIAALAMAVYFRGMDSVETEALMTAMLDSGRRLDLDHLTVPRIDKHSTGGVGDKVSIVLAPLVAACGVAVPMMSGRGLGHTGGTLDKLESIPGFRTRLTLEEAARQVERLGCALIGQTEEIAPADRRFYALRDATATVEAIPLIAASIMSKKLAEGLTGLVLDVKTGAGAFMTRLDDSLKLAATMISIGERHGCPTVALLTDMDAPLGVACGNAVEITESIDVLKGGGPADLREVTVALTAEMVLLARLAPDLAAARLAVEAAIADGRGLAKLREITAAQGGDPACIDDPGRLPRAAHLLPVRAPRAGLVEAIDAEAIGLAAMALGAGRVRVEDRVDPAVGVVLCRKVGDPVEAGAPLCLVHRNDGGEAQERVAARIAAAYRIGPGPVAAAPLVLERMAEP